MKKTHKVGDWIFHFQNTSDFQRFERGWRLVSCAVGKLREVPGEGELLTRKHIRGVMFRFAYWLPFHSF